ncbi:hypothetical protein HNV12_04245 [Methanococcoides sp. SA1]|nr:hypothetical protein [Methanococcoides sp. SA1]
MDPIKEAFSKIKQDIIFLKEELQDIKSQISTISNTPTHNTLSTHQQTDNPTHNQTFSTHNYPIQPSYIQNNHISTGNEGVPTNTQTHQQTHQQTENSTYNSDFKQANEILESLDNIKKEIRLKFKRLTPQEMLVFSTLYSFEEQNIQEITYKLIANQLTLSQSSIRDYINKLINKGVPIQKTKQNNKTIILNISSDLKNIATLATIKTLREL